MCVCVCVRVCVCVCTLGYGYMYVCKAQGRSQAGEDGSMGWNVMARVDVRYMNAHISALFSSCLVWNKNPHNSQANRVVRAAMRR